MPSHILTLNDRILELRYSHLTVHMFPESGEQQKKLALLSLSGAIGNVLGL